MFTLSRRCLQRDSTRAVLPLPSRGTRKHRQAYRQVICAGSSPRCTRAPLAGRAATRGARHLPPHGAANADGEGALVPVALGLVERRVALVELARVVHVLVRVPVPVARAARSKRAGRQYGHGREDAAPPRAPRPARRSGPGPHLSCVWLSPHPPCVCPSPPPWPACDIVGARRKAASRSWRKGFWEGGRIGRRAFAPRTS